MWTTHNTAADSAGALRVALSRDSTPATYAEVIGAWRGDGGFRSWFITILAGVPYDAFRWETPPVSTATVTRPFEFVVLDSPDLARRPDPDAFDEHFRGQPGSDVLTFPNIGRDAILVVPRPIAPVLAYGHLAAFTRHAPERQRDAFWQSVGDAMTVRLGSKPVWLSTAGGGVSWLHVRLDDRPKYYGFAPYRRA